MTAALQREANFCLEIELKSLSMIFALWLLPLFAVVVCLVRCRT